MNLKAPTLGTATERCMERLHSAATALIAVTLTVLTACGHAPLEPAKAGNTSVAGCDTAAGNDAAVAGPACRRTGGSARHDAGPEAGAGGTALFVIRFANAVNPQFQPTNLALTIEDPVQRSGGQFGFKPFRAIPGQFAEFLVRLELPPGDYRITRLFGIAGVAGGDRQTAPQFDFPAQQRFVVEAGQTAYLGRIAITNRLRRSDGETATGSAFGADWTATAGFAAGSPSVTAHDETDEDLVSFRSHWSDLRERRIETRLSASFVVPSPQGSGVPDLQARFPQGGSGVPAVPAGTFVSAQPLSAAAAAALPPTLRSAFARFAVSKLPRAFAFHSSGAFGAASGGQQVIARALQQCEQQRGRNPAVDRTPCVLYAIDDTVVEASMRAMSGATVARQGTPAPPALR